MKMIVLIVLQVLVLSSCAQEKYNFITMDVAKPIRWMPFLTPSGEFIYVDKELKEQLPQRFYQASPFLETGYALVGDDLGRKAIINASGELVMGYGPDELELEIIGGLTVLKWVKEYEKFLAPWNWKWNIMSKNVYKKATYVRVVIQVLETNQTLLDKEVPLGENPYSLNPQWVGPEKVVLNDIVYQIQDKRFVKVDQGSLLALDNQGYILASGSTWRLYGKDSKKPLLKELTGLDDIQVNLGPDTFVFSSINQTRFAPEVPKILKSSADNQIYLYPQYDKAFPKEIQSVSPEEMEFLKQTSMIYSISDSPYFLLGRFDYDSEIWAYDWMYLDQNGQVHSQIPDQDFYVLDQLGSVVYPEKRLVFNPEIRSEFHKIGRYYLLDKTTKLYITTVYKNQDDSFRGVFDSQRQIWVIEPKYYDIQILNQEHQILKIQDKPGANWYLFDLKQNKVLGTQDYYWIHSNGKVDFLDNPIYPKGYYIDIRTGKEYK